MILRQCVARFSLVRHFPGSGLRHGAGSQDDFCVVPWYALLTKPAKSSWSLPEPVFCTVFHDFQGVSLRVSEGFRRGFLGVSKGFRWGFRGFLLLGKLFYLHGAHLYVRPSDTIIILPAVVRKLSDRGPAGIFVPVVVLQGSYVYPLCAETF